MDLTLSAKEASMSVILSRRYYASFSITDWPEKSPVSEPLPKSSVLTSATWGEFCSAPFSLLTLLKPSSTDVSLLI
jgi:hypothetical protein